jgi:mannonate dehydratase
MEQTFRWFGPNDPVTLPEIRQTGATGIVTALHQIPIGEVWSVDEIQKRKMLIEAGGLSWSVTESVPVHESIKKRTGEYRRYIESYKTTLRNLGKCGIDTVCYNFMPVLDWSRTELNTVFRDGSITSRFEAARFAAFDLFILKRNNAESFYSPVQVNAARTWFEKADDSQKDKLTETVLLGLPGSGDAYTLEAFRDAIGSYAGVRDGELRENLSAFIREVVPAAEESGVFLAIHPDDPPWPLLGLPRVVSTAKDVERILSAVDSPVNGITLCTGSFGARPDNNLVAMAGRFARRVSFVHLRNVRSDRGGGFVEENHLEGDVDLYGVIRAILFEQKRRAQEGRKDRRMPMRPDHGHLMLPDAALAEQKGKNTYPGYSLWGRMRGLAELRGLEIGILRAHPELAS